MTRFFKHVGETNGKKVVIVQRSLPGEDHMAAVIYSSIIPSKYHDDVMRLLESDEGQQSNEFRDILARRLTSDGGPILQALAGEGYIKKVATNSIIVKPNSASSIRLDELNNLLRMAGQGQQAIDRLAQLDRETGLKDTRKNPAAQVKELPKASVPAVKPVPALVAPIDGVLTDEAIATHSLKQAQNLRDQAHLLIEEAAKLEKDAIAMVPELATKKGRKRGPKPKSKTAETGSEFSNSETVG